MRSLKCFSDTMSTQRIMLAFPLLLAAGCLGATKGWMIQEENDKFTNGNSDRYYTQGLRASWQDDDLSQWSFGQEINTPANHFDTNPVGDLPYSAFLYVGRGQGFLFPRSQAMASVEAKFGVIGPLALGRQIQNGFHHIIGSTEYSGWDTQIPNEPAVSLEAEVRRRFYLDDPEVHHWDLIVRLAAELGNVRSGFTAGFQLRYGLLDESWGHGFLRQSTAWVDPVSPGGPRAGNWWFFVDISAEVMPHNYMTDGTVFSASRSVDGRPVVLQGALGVSLAMGSGSLSFAIAHRTKDFYTQDGSHAYGSVRFTQVF